MKHFNPANYFLPFSVFLFITILSPSCEKEEGRATSIAGTYQGVAMVEEQVLLDGELVFDTSFTTTDQLIVTEVDVANYHYHFELISGFETSYTQSPLDPTEYFLDENYIVWEGLDEYGYTYDNKKHWIFDPQQDTVYFYLARFPYGPTIIDNPDSIGHSFEEFHTWSYVLRAVR